MMKEITWGTKGQIVDSNKMDRERSRLEGKDFINPEGATDHWLSLLSKVINHLFQ
jgi:hypothetical protein